MNSEVKKDIVLEMKYVGDDFWSQPTYCDQFDRLWKDIGLGENVEPSLSSVADNEIDGEPYRLIKQKFILKTRKDFLSSDKSFQYQMLDRMRCDCEYYLGYGCRNSDVLYEKNEKMQIEAMKAIWCSFSEEEKPEWITWEKILEYEKSMCGPTI